MAREPRQLAEHVLKANHELLSFNRGIVSPLLMGRADVQRVALSAATQTNFMPRTLGPMSLRPGLQYLGATASNAAAKHIPFVYSITDTGLIEVTDYLVRVRMADALVTRASVATAIANGTFTSDLTSWTAADEGSASSVWLTGGYMSLQGTGTSAAIRRQTVTVAGGDVGVVHALNITVTRGPVTLRVGSSSGGDEYITEVALNTGRHSLAFTPTGTSVYIALQTRLKYPVLVDSIAIASSGVMSLVAPWPAAYLGRIRYAQSGDVVFVDCDGVRPMRIVRRGTGSWSVEDLISNLGPFRNVNLTETTVTASALTGLITLTASTPIFKSTHVGGLFKLKSDGQAVTQTASAQNTFTNSIKVTGVGAARTFGLTITGTWAGTVTLQRSVDGTTWKDVVPYIVNASTTLDDGLDNQIIYYRLGIKTGGYTSGSAVMDLVYATGSIYGIARVSAFTSSTVVTAFVVQDLGSAVAVTGWSEGSWSDYRGHPSACALREGRLWHVGKDKFWASVVDDFANNDAEYVGDAGPINRSIGDGPVDRMSWLISSLNLMAGGGGAEFLARSTTLEEGITPFNFNVRPTTTLGSYGVDADMLDQSILFIDRSGTRLIELTPNGSGYSASDLTQIYPEALLPYVVDIAVQRRPDARVHCVLSNGTVRVLVYNKLEDQRAWVTVTTSGTVEEVIVLPGTEEDAVYYVVNRTVNSATVRYLEKWALESACVGGNVNKQADAFGTYSGAATTSIPAAHLVGATCSVWADGLDVGPLVATAGTITLTTAAANVVYGLPYTGQFKSVKLAQSGIALSSRKRVNKIGVLLVNTHAQGLKYGPDFSTLDDLPAVEAGAAVTATGIWSDYNYDHIAFNGTYTVDSRLCLQAASPRPCTVLACVIELEI